jgi:hypothetical protein
MGVGSWGDNFEVIPFLLSHDINLRRGGFMLAACDCQDKLKAKPALTPPANVNIFQKLFKHRPVLAGDGLRSVLIPLLSNQYRRRWYFDRE